MKTKTKLLLYSFLIFFLLTSFSIFFSLSLIKKEEQWLTRLYLKEKAELLEERILPHLLTGQIPLFLKQKENYRIFQPFCLKTKDKIFFSGTKKEKDLLKTFALKEKIEKKKGKNFVFYKKNIKTIYSNHVWGEIFVCKKLTPLFLSSPIPYRLLIVYLLFIFLSTFIFSFLYPQKQFIFSKGKFSTFLPLYKRLEKLLISLHKEKESLDKNLNELLQKIKNKKEIQENIKTSEKIKLLTQMKRSLFEAQKNISSHNAIIGIAHEINNPLTTIIGYLQLLAHDKSLKTKIRENLSKNVEKIFNIKEKLEKLIAASTEQTKESFELAKIFLEANERYPFLNYSSDKRISLTGNIERYRKVFFQFLQNILKFEPTKVDIKTEDLKDSIKITIKITTEKEIDELSFKKTFLDFLVFFEIYGTIETTITKDKAKIEIILPKKI